MLHIYVQSSKYVTFYLCTYYTYVKQQVSNSAGTEPNTHENIVNQFFVIISSD